MSEREVNRPGIKYVDEMYDRLMETLNEFDAIIERLPEYISDLENVVADVEKAVVDALEKQFANDYSPKNRTMKYVQKLTKISESPCVLLPEEFGTLLNSMKRIIDVQRPRIHQKLESKGAEQSSETASKYRIYCQAVVAKLAKNIKLKKILKDSKDEMSESDIRTRMQPLRNELV